MVRDRHSDRIARDSRAAFDRPRQAVEKRFQQPAPSLLSLPRRERSLGRKPVFTQGVDGKSEIRRLFEGFFNTLLLCCPANKLSERERFANSGKPVPASLALARYAAPTFAKLSEILRLRSRCSLRSE